MPAAGKFDRRVVIQKATTTPDSMGQPIPTWAPFSGDGKRWAEFDPRPGTERFSGQQLVAKNAVQFRVRYDSVVATVTASEAYRIVFDGRNYDITDVTPSAKRRETIAFVCFARAE